MNDIIEQNSNEVPTNGEKGAAETNVVQILLFRRELFQHKLRDLEEEIKRVNHEYTVKTNELLRQKKPLEESLFHIEALLRLEAGESTIKIESDKTTLTSISQQSSINDAAFTLLQSTHESTHYTEIAKILSLNGVIIPGKNPSATLLSRISRDNRFKRMGKRGVYGLLGWHLKSSRKNRKKRIRKSSKT